MIDLVVTTYNRLDLLKRTLAYIWQRTTTSYRLQVIDDCSEEGNQAYLYELLEAGQIAEARIHTRNVGIASHLRSLDRITTSDPIVFTDDDILCPKLDPDWLARALAEMERMPDLGMLALNTPGCNVRHSRGDAQLDGNVTLCRNVPGSFCFVRREILPLAPPDGVMSPVKRWCKDATDAGWKVGYLTHVYAQHIGPVSMRTGRDWSGDLDQVLPVDPDTLAPPEIYRW